MVEIVDVLGMSSSKLMYPLESISSLTHLPVIISSERLSLSYPLGALDPPDLPDMMLSIHQISGLFLMGARHSCLGQKELCIVSATKFTIP